MLPMSAQAYLAPGVLIVLFHRIFDVVRSAVWVVNSPGIVYLVSTRCYSDMVGVIFLGAIIDNNSGVGNGGTILQHVFVDFSE